MECVKVQVSPEKEFKGVVYVEHRVCRVGVAVLRLGPGSCTQRGGLTVAVPGRGQAADVFRFQRLAL